MVSDVRASAQDLLERLDQLQGLIAEDAAAHLESWRPHLQREGFADSAANLAAYLALPNVICVGGSWVMPADAIESGDWKRIEGLAREAAALRTA